MNADYLLIRSTKNGNSKAAEILIRKYYANVFNYCKYHSTDIHTAEDITQEVFLTFINEIHNYKHHGKLLNFLYTIARNKCIDERRKMSNKDVSTECVIKNLEIQFTDFKSGIDYFIVKDAIESLPSDIKEIIILYYYLGMKQKEIAEICNIGISLVKFRIKKGKDLIKKYLEDES